jgi:hypothetical protein
VAITDEIAVDAAFTAYNGLSAAVKALLTPQKSLLDNLKSKIAELKSTAANQAAANAFKDAHATILAKTVDTVAIGDESAVDAALTAYNGLSATVKALLGTEKTLLDNLKTKIEALIANQTAANAFKANHTAILAKTDATVVVTDEDAVDTALTAYNGLSAAVKASLGTEKALLDDLKAKIGELKRPFITITDGQMIDEAFTLTPLSLYRGDPEATRIVTVNLGTGYTAIKWSVGAAVLGWADGSNTFTFDAADWPAGTYILGVTVEKAGKGWSKNVTITVTNGVSPL